MSEPILFENYKIKISSPKTKFNSDLIHRGRAKFCHFLPRKFAAPSVNNHGYTAHTGSHTCHGAVTFAGRLLSVMLMKLVGIGKLPSNHNLKNNKGFY